MLGESVLQVPRPSSALSSRPASRSSHRHQPRGRQSARHVPFVQDLISQTLRCSKGDPKHAIHVETAMKALDSGRHNAPICDAEAIDKRIKNLVDKHRVLLNDGLAEALGTSFNTLRTHVKETSTRESQVTTKNLPDVLQMLFALSATPDEETHAHAAVYIERQQHPNGRPKEAITWDAILQEEPFEGQHWEGAYGLPSGATKEGWETQNVYDLSESDLSDFGDLEMPLKIRGEQKRDSGPPLIYHPESESSDDDESEYFDARVVVEEVKRLQYWRTSAATSEPVAGPAFDLGDPSSLASTIAATAQTALPANREIEDQAAVILEADAVREALFMLQDNASIFTSVVESGPLNLPKIQESDPKSLAQRATTMRQLRAFARVVFDTSYTFPASSYARRRSSTRTLEAFTAALDAQVRRFDTWCAAYEERLCISQNGKQEDQPNVCSLLSLEHRTSGYMGTSFDLLLKLVHDILSICSSADGNSQAPKSEERSFNCSLVPPSILCTFMLDELIAAARSEHLRGLSASAHLIMEVFATTIEPLWSSLGAWMSRGMDFTDATLVVTTGSGNESELFIHRNENIPVNHSDFWMDGYKVISEFSQDFNIQAEYDNIEQVRGPKHRAIPTVFRAFANEILSAGKSVGLLRVLQSDDILSLDTSESCSHPLQEWPSFCEVIGCSTDKISLNDEHGAASRRYLQHVSLSGASADAPLQDSRPTETLLSELSGEDVAMLIHERLEPWCRIAHSRLNRVIVDDCQLWHHIAAVEGLYFMRRGETMAQFCQTLFSRIQDRQPWSDYHTLNSLFRDVAVSTLSDEPWIDHHLVRLTFRGIRARDPFQSIKALDGLALEYQVPFPLNYLLDPYSMRSYSSIFNLLLQLRFAKLILDGIVVRATRKGYAGAFSSDDLRTFYAVRGRLIWFVSTMMYHVAVNVIELHVRGLHGSLQRARSLDEMITSHANSLSLLLSMCGLGSSASSVRRGIQSVLDLALRLNEVYNDAQDRSPVNVPTGLFHPTVEKRVGRSGRRQRRMNKAQRSRRINIIGFSSDVHVASDDDPEDDARVAQEEADILEEPSCDDADASAFGCDDATSKAENSMAFPSAAFSQRIEGLSSELDALVRYVMKYIEGLSEGGAISTVSGGLQAEAFSMLNFAFEDWDL